MEKSIIIIGAGIAGLSAGCYGQMNDYRIKIFEMHSSPGGVCTTWKRKGYKIDGCIHWLTGSRPGTSFHRMWEELEVLQDRLLIDHQEYARIESKGGEIFKVFTDINRLEQHMIDLAPEDKDLIRDFAEGVRTSIHFPIPWEKAPELYSPIDGFKIMLKMRPFFNFLRKWEKLTIQDFAQRFKNPILRQTFPYIFNLENPPDFPFLGLLMTLAWMHQKTAAYPVGGSLEIARSIEQCFLSLGGEVHYKSRVERILLKNNRAVGIRLADGSEHFSDIVISAADGHMTIFDLLEGKYLSNKIQRYYDELPLYSPLVYIGLGVARKFEEIPPTVTGINFPLDEPIMISKQERKRLSVQFYNFDPTLAPTGKTFLRVMFASDYEYWKNLKNDPERYKVEKEQIADRVVAALDRRFPGLASQVEMRDVATPMTWVRYTGNWRGSFQGWLETTKTLRMRMSKTLPGLKNFYMAGQWVEPGGSIPTAAMSGRNVTQIICNKDKRPFITTIP